MVCWTLIKRAQDLVGRKTILDKKNDLQKITHVTCNPELFLVCDGLHGMYWPRCRAEEFHYSWISLAEPKNARAIPVSVQYSYYDISFSAQVAGIPANSGSTAHRQLRTDPLFVHRSRQIWRDKPLQRSATSLSQRTVFQQVLPRLRFVSFQKETRARRWLKAGPFVHAF